MVRVIRYTKVKNTGDTFILCRLVVEDMVVLLVSLSHFLGPILWC